MRVRDAVAALAAAGIRVSLFIDPEAGQIEAARRAGAPVIELHTGAYADAAGGARAYSSGCEVRQSWPLRSGLL